MPHTLQLLWKMGGEGGGGVVLEHVHKKSQISATNNTVLFTIVACRFSHAPLFLARRIRLHLVTMLSLTKPFSLASFAPSHFSCLSHLSSMSARRSPTPVTAQIFSALACWEQRYLFFAITGFRSTNPDSLTRIVIRSPTMGERVFLFPKKKTIQKCVQYHLLHYHRLFPCIPSDMFKK